MELNLLVADENGLVNLADVVKPGDHFTVARNDNTGVVRLTPVTVTTTKAAEKVHDPYNSLPQG